MSKILKLQRNGELFELSHYPTLCAHPSDSASVRSRREKESTIAKKRINARQSKLSMLRFVHANYISGRDLFVSLSFSESVTETQARNAFAKFSKLCRAAYKQQWRSLDAQQRRRLKKRGIDGQYRYILTMEDHSRDGEPVNLHFHAFISCNPLRRIRALKLFLELWQQAAGAASGSVKVETLSSDFLLEDTVNYFLKQRRPKGKKRWSKSRNHRQPEKPFRTRIPDGDAPDPPPGCRLIDGITHFNEFGCYGWMLCRIEDKRVFNRWYNRQLKKIAPQ